MANRQSTAAAKKKQPGHSSKNTEPVAHLTDAADAMLAALVKRADDLMG